MRIFTNLIATEGYTDIRRELIACKRELLRKHARLQAKLPTPHNSPEFDKKILSYINSLRTARKSYKPEIARLADKITALCATTPDWGNNSAIVGLWYELADAIRIFSFNIDKKNSALLIDETGKLISWDISRLPKGLPRRAEFFKKGKRSKFNLCAEAMVLANANKQSTPQLDNADNSTIEREVRILKRHGMDADEILHSREKAKIPPQPYRLYMVCTTPPCEECSNAIVANYTAGVLSGVITRNLLSNEERAQYGRDTTVHRRIAERVPMHRVRVNADNPLGHNATAPYFSGYFATKKWRQYWQEKRVKPARPAAKAQRARVARSARPDATA